MIAFLDRLVRDERMTLQVHINLEGVARGVGPFTHGATVNTDIMKTQALRQALEKFGFDAAIGGARREEEKPCAKERMVSLLLG